MDTFTLPQLYPAFIAVTFYAVIIFLAEVSRKVVDYFAKKGTTFYIFLIELIAVAQNCTCVYENGVMIRNYGTPGFFIAVLGILLVTSKFNRGAFVSPFAPIEMFYYGSITTEKFLAVLLAQTVGGYSAYRIANSLWYYTLDYSVDHSVFFKNLPCSIQYKVPFYYVIGFELVACFIIRLLISRTSENYKRYVVPVIFASFLSFALSYIGIPGLNPVTASSRLQGCPGLDLQWFMITYWVTPVIGWMAGSQFDRRAKVKAGGKNKKRN